MQISQDLFTRSEYLGIFILLVLGGFGLPFPRNATLLLTGVLLSAGEVRLIPATVTAYVGVMVPDVALYLAGRRYGRRALKRRPFSRALTPARLEKIGRKFRRYHALVIVVGRNIPGVRLQVMVAAGILRVPFWQYALADSAAVAATIALMVWAGYAGGEKLPEVRRIVTGFWVVILAAALAFAALYGVYRLLKTRRLRSARGDKSA